MSGSQIIDNRTEKLADHIRAFLPGSKSAKFAVGYFFLSGLEALGSSLDNISDLRLLIGNTTNRETVEQLSEAYKRLEMVEEEHRKQRFARKDDLKRATNATAGDIRATIGLMDQNDDAQELVHQLVRMVTDGRLHIRVYTKGRLHAKAYIFDYTNPSPTENGIAIVGSSNLTLSGIQDNTELNVVVHDNAHTNQPGTGNHGKLTSWFEELWDEAEDFDELLMTELQQSWAVQLATPYDIYMKTLYTLVSDRLGGEGESAVLLSDDEITRGLADFQRVAVQQAVRMLNDFNGCFVADVVGLGKSFIGAAILKHFEKAHRSRPLIICPKSLEDMWIAYNEKYHLNAQVLPMSMLQEGERGVDLLTDPRYRDRDFVLIDESHNFRNTTNQRYRELERFIQANPERKVCLLTATPRNSRIWDVFNQIKLFHPEDRTETFQIDPPNLREYFNKIEKENSVDPADDLARLQDVLRQVLIRRTRRHILRWYGYAEDSDKPLRDMNDIEAARYLDGVSRAYVNVGNRKQFFPRRELETLRYSIEETYSGLYQEIRGLLGRPLGKRRRLDVGNELTYARYGLWNYVLKARQNDPQFSELKRAGQNLHGLMRTMLFKRFESSVHAFRETLRRMISTQEGFLVGLDGGLIAAGEGAEALLGRTESLEDSELLDALADVSKQYNSADFNVDLLGEHVRADIDLLRRILALVEPITPDQDAKLQTLKERLGRSPISNHNKCLIFTEFADTAQYLYENLNPGNTDPTIDYIYGADKSKSRVVARFAPKANPEYYWRFETEPETRLLVATDVLSEGLNMQDCDIVINYDLHWNPVRLIQRFGRIDRIGSEHDVIYGMNFLPEQNLEKQLGLQQVLSARIREIHDTIGEDAPILDRSEQINDEAMYSIYEGQRTGQLSLFEDDPAEFVDLNEAEEILRNLRRDNPDEYQRIANLRDGIRSVGRSAAGDLFVFCQSGQFQQLFLVNDAGEIVSRDSARVLGAIKAGPEDLRAGPLPDGYNRAVMAIREWFADEARQRETQLDHVTRLNTNQRYIRQQLLAHLAETDDEEQRTRINEMERAFVGLTPTTAVNRELTFLRTNKVSGEHLVSRLIDLYHQHHLAERLALPTRTPRDLAIPRIVCSSALVD